MKSKNPFAKEKKFCERNFLKLPKHIAFILDGNGRWAKKRNWERMVGHKFGAKKVVELLNFCAKIKMSAVSLYAFSTENINRPKPEVDGLFEIFEDYISKYYDKIVCGNFRFVVSGDISIFSDNLQNLIMSLCTDCLKNNGMFINLCVNYSGRDEIIHAINLIIDEKKVNITNVDFENYLYTKKLPPLDFVIRTGREQRISNFMIWQIAYAELYFSKTMWPDFSEKLLIKALKSYIKRERRFGRIPTK